MSIVDGDAPSGLVKRVQDILRAPKPTWDVIDGEPATVKGLYTGYAMILAAIPAIAGLIGSVLTPFGGVGIVGAVVSAAATYGFSLLGLYIFALIVDALAPSFDGSKDQIQAFKAVVYGSTASWVGGAALFIPVIGGLIAFAGGIYSLYLLYLGLPKLMKVPEQKAMGFVIVVIVLAVVIQMIVFGIAATLATFA